MAGDPLRRQWQQAGGQMVPDLLLLLLPLLTQSCSSATCCCCSMHPYRCRASQHCSTNGTSSSNNKQRWSGKGRWRRVACSRTRSSRGIRHRLSSRRSSGCVRACSAGLASHAILSNTSNCSSW